MGHLAFAAPLPLLLELCLLCLLFPSASCLHRWSRPSWLQQPTCRLMRRTFRSPLFHLAFSALLRPTSAGLCRLYLSYRSASFLLRWSRPSWLQQPTCRLMRRTFRSPLFHLAFSALLRPTSAGLCRLYLSCRLASFLLRWCLPSWRRRPTCRLMLRISRLLPCRLKLWALSRPTLAGLCRLYRSYRLASCHLRWCLPSWRRRPTC